MDNIDISFEKRLKIVMGVIIAVVLLVILNLATLMSALPTFLEAKIAHAPTRQWIAIQNLMELMKYKQ